MYREKRKYIFFLLRLVMVRRGGDSGARGLGQRWGVWDRRDGEKAGLGGGGMGGMGEAGAWVGLG